MYIRYYYLGLTVRRGAKAADMGRGLSQGGPIGSCSITLLSPQYQNTDEIQNIGTIQSAQVDRATAELPFLGE